MSLQYIIDGYNIINHPKFFRANKFITDPSRALLSFIKSNRLTGSSKNIVIIVFDGFPPQSYEASNFFETAIIFSRKINADEKIKRMVEESANRKNIIVVSDDKEIKFMIRSLGAQHLSIEDFIGRDEGPAEAKGKKKSKELSKQELNYTQMRDIDEELKKIWLK